MARYDVSARGYFLRALRLLNEETYAALFHAAFELRCGIESRMQEYLSVREDIGKKKKRGYKIGPLGKELDRAFRTRKVACVTISHPDEERPIFLVYTPVTRKLERSAKLLGDYLHAQRVARADHDTWWEETRHFLEDIARELQISVSGNLLGPMMLSPSADKAMVHIEIRGPRRDDIQRLRDRRGERVRYDVEYRNSISAGELRQFGLLVEL